MLYQMWTMANEYFVAFMGTGFIVILYLAATLYLFLVEKRKPFRIMFVYVPFIILLLFYNPLVTWIVSEHIDGEIYYRILWLLPVTVVLAFTIVDIYGKLQGKKKGIFAVAAVCVIAISGSYVYLDPLYSEAENMYHVPQSVVDICDMIEVEGREVMAVFPEELLIYVRQYSPVVCMPYGREVTVDRWNFTQGNRLYKAMEADRIKAEKLAELAREKLCAYIILPEDKEVVGNLNDYDFETFGAVEGYIIYKDSTVSLEIY